MGINSAILTTVSEGWQCCYLYCAHYKVGITRVIISIVPVAEMKIHHSDHLLRGHSGLTASSATPTIHHCVAINNSGDVVGDVEMLFPAAPSHAN